jgi:predicted acylesterase/phospholipase RssA
VRMAGASAGSLSAVMAACGCDMDHAFAVAARLAEEREVWTRPDGLGGIWGDMIAAWLDECLPDDAAARCSGRVSVSVTRVRAALKPLKRESIERFADKQAVPPRRRAPRAARTRRLNDV